MIFEYFQTRTLKTRVTLFTLVIFLISIWSLALYAGRVLRKDMQQLSSDQQFSTVVFIASGVNEELESRLRTLEKVAARITPGMFGNPAALQTFIEERLILQDRFNGGTFATSSNGTAIASIPRSAERVGVNFMERNHIAAALQEGTSTIGKPVISKVLHDPIVSMAVPIRDRQGRVIGALSGVTDLSQTSFLDKVTVNRYGKSGGYFITVPQYRLNITATDKSCIMQPLPAPGVNPAIDRFVQGFEGSQVYVDQRGVEVLGSAKRIPAAGWQMIAALPTEEAFAPIRAMQQRMLLTTIFLTMLTGGCIWWMVRRQLSPMLAAVQTLATLSDTNQPPQQLPVTTQGEIGQLIGGFNRLLETLAQRERDLQESKEVYQTLFREMLDGFALHEIICDVQGNPIDYRFLAINPAFERLTGLTAETLIDRTVLEVMPATERYWIEAYGEVALTGSPAFLKNYSEELNKYFEVTAFQSAPGQFACIFIDITERTLAERYREMGRDVLQILNEPGDLYASIQRIINLLQVKTGFDAIGIRLQNGDDFPYFVSDGLSPDFLRLENSLVQLDDAGRECRDGRGEITLECICGQVLTGHIDPDDPLFTSGGSFWSNNSLSLLEIPSGKDSHVHYRNRCIHDGYSSIALVPIRSKEGIIGLIQFNDRRKGRLSLDSVEAFESIASHIGAALMRKQVEEETSRLEVQFQQTQRLESLGVLAGGIAHDFNNILNIIIGHCYIIGEDIDSGMDHKTHVAQITKAANRAADLCRQMLSYAGKGSLLQTRINLWLLLDENVKLLQAALKKNVGIELDLKYDVPEITGDIAQIQQIIMNLIINAAEAIGDKNGTIKITLRRLSVTADRVEYDFVGAVIPPGTYACFMVSDNGCGMDAETQKRIFEPFFTTKYTGRGLGLSAVLGIIKSHGGQLQLSSVPESGTFFKVFFPSFDMVQAPEDVEVVTFVASPKEHGTVLLVDDEEPLRIIGSALLKAMGFSVMTAANGCKALELFTEQRAAIDLVLMDEMMPEKGGLETYEILREQYPYLPIVICSGYTIDDIQEKIAADPCSAVIQKPYRPNELRNTLTELISQCMPVHGDTAP
jgi:PAS domain S-box-containing protein